MTGLIYGTTHHNAKRCYFYFFFTKDNDKNNANGLEIVILVTLCITEKVVILEVTGAIIMHAFL